MRRLAVALLAAAPAAQFPTGPHVVLTRLAAGNPSAQVLAVDPAAGTFQALPRFPADALPPLAVALDWFDRSLLLALDSAGTHSRIVRLERAGGAFVETTLVVLPGTVTSLYVHQEDLLAAIDGSSGGLFRMPRRGGPATLVLAQPNLTAMNGSGPYGTAAVVAWTGRPGTAAPASGVGLVDTTTGGYYLGPHQFQNQSGIELTGAIDLPTGVPRQLLAFADGTFALFAGLIGPPQPLATLPVIPPGGALALHAVGAFGPAAMAVGGASFPHLYEVDPWQGVVTLRSVALPGAPVDFAPGHDRGAQGLAFGQACGPVPLAQGWAGLQQPGNTFAITVQGPPNDHALLVAGLSDLASSGLPAAIPGGCLLHVAPDATLLHLLPGSGFATQGVAVPPSQSYLGAILFSQWLHLGSAGISASSAAAHQIGL